MDETMMVIIMETHISGCLHHYYHYIHYMVITCYHHQHLYRGIIATVIPTEIPPVN